jgi:hypothetical protein
LEALTLPETVLEEVRSGRGKPDRVFKALNQKGVDAFAAEERAALFTFLFDCHDPSLYPGMAQYACRELHEAAMPALHAALAPAPPGSAADAEAEAIVRTFVPPHGNWDDPDVDSYLAGLLAVPYGRRVPLALVEMWLERFAAAPKREWPQVGDALLRTPHVGLAALHRCRETRPKSLNRLIATLCRERSAPWTTVLRWAVDLPDAGAGAGTVLAKAAQECPGVVVEAFRFAAAYRSFDAVDVPLWREWLRIAADERLPEHAELGAEVAAYGPRHSSPATPRGSARMGLLRHLYARQFSHPTSADATEYVAELADALRILPRGRMPGHAAVDMLRNTLASRRNQPDGAELTVAVLLAALDRADDLGPDACAALGAEASDTNGRLRPAVRRALAADPAAWHRLMAGVPQLAVAERLGQLEDDARTDRSAIELAGHWAWLLNRGVSGTEADKRIRGALQSWPGVRRPGEVHELLLGVRSTLIHDHHRSAQQVNTWTVGMARAITKNWLGPQAADHLRNAVLERRGSTRVEDQLLAPVVADPPAAPPRPSAAPRRPAAPPEDPAADPAPDPAPRAPGGPRSPADWSTRWYRRRQPLLIATGSAVAVALVLLVLFLMGVFDGGDGKKSPGPSTPPATSAPPAGPAPVTSAPGTSAATSPDEAARSSAAATSPTTSAPSTGASSAAGTPPQATTPLRGSLGPPIWYIMLAVLLGGGALFYRRPRWTGQLTLRVRNDTGPGYQVAGVLIPDRLGRALVNGQPDTFGVVRLGQTTARVKVAARRSWSHPRHVDLLVHVRLADSGRRDTVRCPVGGRRMVLGMDVRHDREAQAPLPPRPDAPPPVTATPYPFPPPPDSPTLVSPFPPGPSAAEQPPTVELPPQFAPRPRPTDPHNTAPFGGGEFSGGPETGGPGRWPAN